MALENIPISGAQLVEDFKSAIIVRVTAEVATQEAARSENELLSNLAASSGGGYLNPANMSESAGDMAARASLDAHIKKIQAEQIKSLSELKTQEILSEDKKSYIGRKVRITSLDNNFQPFDILWFDNKHGYRSNPFKKKSIEGTIEDIWIEKNALLIKPKLLRRLASSDLKNFIAYVINPATLEPAVEIALI